jgi:hypothetical protein
MGVTSKPNPARSVIFFVLLLLIVAASTLAYIKQQERLARERLSEALVLSNRRIGMSLDELLALTEQIGSNSEIGIGNAREAVFWIVCSGKFARADVQNKLPEIQLLIEHGASPKNAVHGAILVAEKPDADPFAYCPQ